MLTPSSSQPSRLGDGLVPGDTGVWLVRDGLPVEVTQQSEAFQADQVAIHEQRRAKQICNADRERFKQFYDDELRRKRPNIRPCVERRTLLRDESISKASQVFPSQVYKVFINISLFFS